MCLKPAARAVRTPRSAVLAVLPRSSGDRRHHNAVIQGYHWHLRDRSHDYAVEREHRSGGDFPLREGGDEQEGRDGGHATLEGGAEAGARAQRSRGGAGRAAGGATTTTIGAVERSGGLSEGGDWVGGFGPVGGLCLGVGGFGTVRITVRCFGCVGRLSRLFVLLGDRLSVCPVCRPFRL